MAINIAIQITKNITLSIEGYGEFVATKKWWEKGRHDINILHLVGNEYFIPALAEYYREEESAQWMNLRHWVLSHTWVFEKYGDQYHLVSIVKDIDPRILVDKPETGETIERYNSPSTRWKKIKEFCLPVVLSYN